MTNAYSMRNTIARQWSWRIGNRVVGCYSRPHFPILAKMYRIESAEFFINCSLNRHSRRLKKLSLRDFRKEIRDDTWFFEQLQVHDTCISTLRIYIVEVGECRAGFRICLE